MAPNSSLPNPEKTAVKAKKINAALDKEFQTRNSPLTDRYANNPDINSIYNLFTIILIGLLTNTVIYDYAKTGQFSFGLRLIRAGFNRFEIVVCIWLSYLAVCYLGFCVFQLWAKFRLSISPKAHALADKICISLLLVYYLICLYTAQKLINIFNLMPGSASIVILEQVRLLMKQHAFFRTNSARIVRHKPHTEENELILSSAKQFAYFLFAPTLIYRDEYPRTKTIRWKFVLFNVGEILSIVLLFSLIVERFLIPPFEQFGLKTFTVNEIVIPIVGNLFPGILFMLCAFYSVLHSAQNAFAEMLMFGDRVFYKDWWTARSLSEYFRTWNVIVHDWLFAYVYRDMYEVVVPKNKAVAKLTVFLLSAIIHEWILTVTLNLFLPVQFIQFFLAGAVLTSLNLLDYQIGNLGVLYSIVLGSGMQVNLYTLEYIARLNCPIEAEGTLDFFKPRFLMCGSIQ